MKFTEQHSQKSAYSVSQHIQQIKQDHQHDVTCYVKCPDESCREDYIGATGRRLSEFVIGHSGRDKNSDLLKRCIEKEDKLPSLEEFMILETNYKKNKFRRKKFRVAVYQGKTLIMKHPREICSDKTVQLSQKPSCN